MKKLFVYADFDWLKEQELIGELGKESLRGTDTYSFKYDNVWLRKHTDIILSRDLNNYQGLQYTSQGKNIFGCFADCLPDRWGRLLLNRREQLQAMEEKRPIHRLTSFDYLKGIDDFSRMGAFRFKEDPSGDFINVSDVLQVPPLTDIKELIFASTEIEKKEQANLLPDKKWLFQLLRPGSSLGGARPKASVIDDNKRLYIAKFPSRQDTYDVELWEHFAHLLAQRAGICVAQTKVIKTDNRYHALLSERFDRTNQSKRVHFASAMTLLGLTDGDGATTGKGYLDIVDFILQGCFDVEQNLKELFRRVAFNICIGNTDDHFRNHGFILSKKGWTLSPAYDINPSLYEQQSLLITPLSCESNLKLLLDNSDYYMLTKKTATDIIIQVKQSMQSWTQVASQLSIPKREQDMFSERFDKAFKE